MAYKALYRKYRPQNFAQVVGQSAIVKTLQNAIISKKITHAYLFCGPRGTGKTSVARIFAKALNCVSLNNGEPCTVCTSCKEISESISPDVIEIDAASNNGVDEIRDIREKVKFLPSGAKYKIYIIDEVHMLSTGAFNALLKTLEEPPKHVIFILATTEPQKLPSTIVSRCQRYDFKPLGTFEISMELKKICQKEDAYITDDAINTISEAAEGGMRDALSILDQVISYGNKDISVDDVNTITGTISFDKMCLLMEFIENKNVNNALDTITDFATSGKEVSKIIGALLVFCRDVLLYKSVGNKNTNKYIFEKERFQEISFKLTNAKVMHFIDILCDVQNKIKFSTTPNVYLEIAVIKMCNISDTDLDLIKRVTDIEEKIDNNNFSNSDGITEVDNEKLGLLDTKINQVVTELNKLELPKLSQRVDDLSQIVANRINNTSENGDFSQDIEDIKMEIDQIKNDSLVGNNIDDLLRKIEKLESQIENAPSSNNVDESKLNKDIENLYRKLANLENMVYEIQDISDLNEIKDDIKLLKTEVKNTNKLDIDLSNINIDDEFSKNVSLEINDLKNEVNELKNNNISNVNYDSVEIEKLKSSIKDINDDLHNLKIKPTYTSNQNYDLSEIKEKLEMLESRMYKFISSALSNNKSKPKPIQKPNGQIMLFGDEILSVDYLQKSSKVNVNFEDVSKTDEEIKEFDELEKLNNKNLNDNQEVSASSLEENTYVENEENTEILVDESEIKTDNISEGKESLDESNFEEESEETLFNFETKLNKENELKESTPSIEKPKDEIIQQYFDIETKETYITKKNSSMVVREREEETQDQIMSSIMKHEGVHKLPQDEYQEKEPEVIQQPVIRDKFALYNVKDIEQLLLDSQSQDARNDKNRVTEIWRSLSRAVAPEFIAYGQILQDATIAAVGNKELILTYPTVNECNRVMRSKFKRTALRLIHSKLGDSYNYIALPNNVWQEKRLEYVRQYQIGIKKPTLTPFNIKGLNIIDDNDEYVNREEKIINNAIEFFGDDIVKIEQEN